MQAAILLRIASDKMLALKAEKGFRESSSVFRGIHEVEWLSLEKLIFQRDCNVINNLIRYEGTHR